MDKYYKFFPEYTLHYEFDDSRDGYEYYFFFQTDSTPRFFSMKFFYHQTLLIEFVGLSLDGGRYATPCPCTDGITFGHKTHWDIMYKNFEQDSFAYVFNEFLFKKEFSDEARIARSRFLESVLVFENETERLDFKFYVEEHWEKDKTKYENQIHIPYVPHQLQGNYKKDAFKDECRNILILQKMLVDYRNLQ